MLTFCALLGLTESISYGARTSTQLGEKGFANVHATRRANTIVNSFVVIMKNTVLYPVPHRYFEHFYIVSVLSSIFWGFQIFTKGMVLRTMSGNSTSENSTMSVEQVVLVWLLMTIQGSRRLYESVALVKRSSSKMPLVAYFIGIFYYLAMGVAVWIHGSR